MFKTIIINKTASLRRLQWLQGQTIAPHGVKTVDGCYPDACLNVMSKKACVNELASGSTELLYVTDIPTVTPDKMEAQITAMCKGRRKEAVKASAAPAPVHEKKLETGLAPEVEDVLNGLMARNAKYRADKARKGDNSEGVFGVEKISKKRYEEVSRWQLSII